MAFLSDEWIAALDQAAASSGVGAALHPGSEVSIEQVVTAGRGVGASSTGADDAVSEPDAVYHLVLSDNGACVKPGRHSQPTVRFTTDRATAGAIYAGEQSALGAFRLGLLEVHGDLAALEQHRSELDLLDKAFQSVRAVTEI